MDDKLWAARGFLPAYLLRQAAVAPSQSLARWEARFSGAILTADLSGFTSLAEALGRAGRRGDEELSAILNHHYSAMVRQVRTYGGDVVQFSGDAMTALFAGPPGEDPSAQATLQAVACALVIQQQVGERPVLATSQGEFPLQMRIGVDCGPTYAAVVGSRQTGLLHLLAGPAREGAGRAQLLALPGEVMLAAAAQRVVQERVRTGHQLQDCVQAIALTSPLQAPPASPAETLAPDLPAERLAELIAFLPPSIWRRIETGGRTYVGEHRRVVVLFVGFQGLESRWGPLVRDDLLAYAAATQGVVSQYEGWLAAIDVEAKGSLLIILFGVPSSHEDDEERAVLCAMDLQDRIRRADLAGITRQRIGMSAGYLFVGEIGGESRWTYTAVGDEMNLACRLMEQARWGQVVATPRVQDRAARRAHFTPLGQVLLKGRTGPVPLFEVTGIREPPSALTSRWLSFAGETVGREDELARIRRAGRQALAGEAQMIILCGEAGVGKSRLAGEMIRWWLNEGGRGFSGDCLSYASGTPYRPWNELLQALFGLQPDQPLGARIQRVEERLEPIGPTLTSRVPLLADVLGIPIPDNEVTRHIEGPTRQRGMFDTVLEVIHHRAAQAPLLLLFEDAHWIDVPSLDLIEYVARNCAGRRLLVMLAHRPLGDPPPASYHGVIQLPTCHLITLDALSGESGVALAVERLGLPPGTLLPSEMLDLLGRAQGNPFFIEEILNALNDAGIQVQRRDSQAQIQGDLAAVAIPDTVQDLVQSRIDRLDEDSRLTLKVAAVIGRTVPTAALRAIHPLQVSPGHLEAHLTALERLDLLRIEGFGGEQIYTFKHVVTQEVAYESLLFSQRQALHGAMGQYLEALHSDDMDEVVDLLAHHYRLSGNQAKAFHYLLRAGDRAHRAYTVQEALEYYQQARQWLRTGDLTACWELLQRLESVQSILGRRDEQERTLQEMEDLACTQDEALYLADVLHRRGALLAQSGYPAEGIDLLHQAAVLAQEAGRDSMAGNCLVDLCRACWIQWDTEQCQDALEQARTLFRRSGDMAGEVSALNMRGNIYLATTTRYERALEAFRQAGRIARSIDNRALAALTRVNEAIALLALGAAGEALEVIGSVRAFAERSGGVLLLGMFWFVTGHALMRLGRCAEAFQAARRSLEFFEALRDRNYLVEGNGLVGRILLNQGRPGEALVYLRRACQLAEAGGQEIDAAHFRSFEALAQLQLGRMEAALDASDRVIALLEGYDQRVDDLQHIYFHHFLILDQSGDPEAGQPYLLRAYQTVQEMAADIHDPALKHCFLEGIAGNQEIIRAWERMGGTQGEDAPLSVESP